nr:uncharacterized protein LOC129272112 [Lytechinus pictus]
MSSEGYLCTSLIAAAAYLIGETSWIQKPVGNTKKKPNMFVIMIGPPGTGKSQAINTGATEPLIKLAEERGDKQIIIGRSTSAGLLKQIAANGKAMIVSGEIYDILFKLIKNDNDSGSGDTTLLCELFSGEDEHAKQLNENIREGKPTCESKMGDHIEGVAVSLHVLTTIGEKLLNPDSDGEHSHTVPQHTVEAAAAKFVEHCEAQKEIIMKELDEILKPIIAGCKVQPKPDDLKPAILRFPGKAITYRAFRQSGPRRFRSTIKKEFETCVQSLSEYGTYVELRLGGKTSVFVKKRPDNINWRQSTEVKEEEYIQAFAHKLHSAISRNICDSLEERGVTTVEFLMSDN